MREGVRKNFFFEKKAARRGNQETFAIGALGVLTASLRAQRSNPFFGAVGTKDGLLRCARNDAVAFEGAAL
jgi:hypothetical protein